MRILTHRRHAGLLVGLALTSAASVLACRDITSLAQENPGALSGATLYVPGNAQLIVNGAISDFECAYARFVVGSGLFADELSVGISATANFDYDARRVLTNATYGTNNCGATPSATQQPGIYTPLSTARATADTAGLRHAGNFPDEDGARRLLPQRELAPVRFLAEAPAVIAP